MMHDEPIDVLNEEYELALQDAHDKGEPWFSFQEFLARCPAPKPEPELSPECDEEIPF